MYSSTDAVDRLLREFRAVLFGKICVRFHQLMVFVYHTVWVFTCKSTSAIFYMVQLSLSWIVRNWSELP